MIMTNAARVANFKSLAPFVSAVSQAGNSAFYHDHTNMTLTAG